MSKMLLLQLLPQMLMVVSIMPDSTYGHIGCTAVSTAGETTVTCLFGKDISQKNFNVHRYHTSRSGEELVLACNRKLSGGLICEKGTDTKFDESQRVTNQLILTRPPSNNTQGVQYQCEIVPSENDLVQRCDLIYKASPAVLSVTTTKAITFLQAMDDSDPLDVAVLVIVILFIIAVVIICVTCYIMRKRITSRCSEFFRRVWSGSDEVPEETVSKDASALEKGKPTRMKIPEGLATYYFNLGWREALRNEQDPNEDDKNIGSSKDPHKEKSYAVDKEAHDPEGAAAAQPLLRKSRAEDRRTGEQQSSSVAEQPKTRIETKEEREKREKAENMKAKAERKDITHYKYSPGAI